MKARIKLKNMAKKKKKKKSSSVSILKEIDKSISGTYDDLMTEIQEMQARLAAADMKARKQAKKKAKKNPTMYNYEKLRRDARTQIISDMEGNNFLARIQNALNDIAPIIVVIARLVASLICALLSLTSVKVNIKPEVLAKLNNVYTKAMSIA